jgi:hypothetical protein
MEEIDGEGNNVILPVISESKFQSREREQRKFNVTSSI